MWQQRLGQLNVLSSGCFVRERKGPQAFGSHVPLHSFASSSQACCFAALHHVAWPLQVYQRLLEAGLQPISTTYTALISAYAKGGQLDRALDTFKQMVRAYRTLLLGALARGSGLVSL